MCVCATSKQESHWNWNSPPVSCSAFSRIHGCEDTTIESCNGYHSFGRHKQSRWLLFQLVRKSDLENPLDDVLHLTLKLRCSQSLISFILFLEGGAPCSTPISH